MSMRSPSLCGLASSAAPAIRHHESLARHTVWGVGGKADRYFEPSSIDELGAFLAALPESEPLLWLGLGSNLLVRDGGVRGTVISTLRLRSVASVGATRLRAEAGATCPKVARFAARKGLSGCEFLVGIPGSIGGALAMNAGAFGGEIWPQVASVETIDRRGRRRTRLHDDYRYGYRHLEGPPGEWFVACELDLVDDAEKEAFARIRSLLERRFATQPVGQRSCGSVFRNPPGDHAGRLIEASGLKGLRVGGAVVSEKHANFILNEEGASAADLESLIALVADEVKRQQGISLIPEVQIVGEEDSIGPGSTPIADAREPFDA